MPRSRRLSTIGPLSDKAIIQKHVDAAKAKKPPSTGATPAEFPATQAKKPILNGRPFATRSPPVHIYNDVFTTFSNIYNDKTRAVPSNLQKHIFKLCQASSKLYYGDKGETQRLNAILPIYRVMLDEEILSVPGYSSQADATITTRTSDGQLALRGIMEAKNEIGAGGCDPGLQGCLSYSRYWSGDGVCVCLTLSMPD